ncbi:DNA methyltransferase [Pararhizobium gei]|uniref:DNA methyltransferase n=1 Tax=Pararhizobium gei TaxID=1395951 RepID=UPI0023DADAE2|nr:DNA methyltransferase [Rhizobium gei]
MLEIVSTSKLSAQQKRNQVYPYYAGFSSKFVETILEHLCITKRDVVLDPWNGSGTTTKVCADAGINSIGVDINPFMNIVSDVKSLSLSEISNSCFSVEALLNSFQDIVGDENIAHKAAATFTREVLQKNNSNENVVKFLLANSVRRVYKQAKTKNPTWFSSDIITGIPHSGEKLLDSIKLELKQTRDRFSQFKKEPVLMRPKLETANFKEWLIPSEVSHIITSPPYLTRLDYVKKTLPELLYLNEMVGVDIAALRESMTGSVLTGRYSVDHEVVYIGDSLTATQILKQISGHHSKASKGYYLKFYKNYFESMQDSIRKIAKSKVKSVVCVTQASYYKEIYVDLPLVISEFFLSCGFKEQSRLSFTPLNSIVTVNRSSYASAQILPDETVSIFEVSK